MEKERTASLAKRSRLERVLSLGRTWTVRVEKAEKKPLTGTAGALQALARTRVENRKAMERLADS